jgi:hypothetical protein
MTKHKHIEEPIEVDKPIHFNFGIIKGKMTFKQFLVFIVVICIGSALVFSSIKFNSSFFHYSKDPLKVDKVGVR